MLRLCLALWNLHNTSLVKVWDLGGQANLRPSWQTYYKAAHAVIMVVDSTDRARVGIAKVSWHALHSVHDLKSHVHWLNMVLQCWFLAVMKFDL